MIDLLSWATCNTIRIYPHICIPLYPCLIPHLSHLANFYSLYRQVFSKDKDLKTSRDIPAILNVELDVTTFEL
jgi:hypothetical protein